MKTDNIISFLAGVISSSTLCLVVLTAGHRSINKSNSYPSQGQQLATLQISSRSETPAQKNARETKELNDKIQLIYDRLSGEADRVDRQLNSSLARISQKAASGVITPGQPWFQKDEEHQKALQSKLEATNAAIKQQQALLARKEFAQIFNEVGVTIESIEQDELETLANNTTNPQEKLLFIAHAQQRQLEKNSIDLNRQIQTRAEDTQKRIHDLNKQAADYYRNIQRKAAEIELDAKETANQTALMDAQNKLRTALLTP